MSESKTAFVKELSNACAGDFEELAAMGFWRYNEVQSNPVSTRMPIEATEQMCQPVREMSDLRATFFLLRYVLEMATAFSELYDIQDVRWATNVSLDLVVDRVFAADVDLPPRVMMRLIEQARQSLLSEHYVRQSLRAVNIKAANFNGKVN